VDSGAGGVDFGGIGDLAGSGNVQHLRSHVRGGVRGEIGRAGVTTVSAIAAAV